MVLSITPAMVAEPSRSDAVAALKGKMIPSEEVQRASAHEGYTLLYAWLTALLACADAFAENAVVQAKLAEAESKHQVLKADSDATTQAREADLTTLEEAQNMAESAKKAHEEASLLALIAKTAAAHYEVVLSSFAEADSEIRAEMNKYEPVCV